MEDTIQSFVLTALTRLEAAGADDASLLNLRLSTLGLDSLDFMELLNDVEERFDVTIEDDAVTGQNTVAEFIAAIEALVAARNPEK